MTAQISHTLSASAARLSLARCPLTPLTHPQNMLDRGLLQSSYGDTAKSLYVIGFSVEREKLVSGLRG